MRGTANGFSPCLQIEERKRLHQELLERLGRTNGNASTARAPRQVSNISHLVS